MHATANDDTSMVIAASQGVTQPANASGVTSRCQASAACRLWRALRCAWASSVSSAASDIDGWAASAEWG
ncbi:hypothetical protein WJ967_12965 [Achromobacter xylosoxidans]